MKTNKYQVTYEGYYDCVTEVVEAEGVILDSDDLILHKNNEAVFLIRNSRLIRLKRVDENNDENRWLKKSV